MSDRKADKTIADIASENGDLPEGWSIAIMRDVTLVLPNVNPKERAEAEFGYIDISSIDNGANKVVDVRRIKGADAPSRARRPIQAGDVLFSNVRTYLRNIAMVPPNIGADICSTGFTVIRSNGSTDPKYLFYFTLTDAFVDPLTEQQTGSSYPAVTDRIVMKSALPLPPLAEQKRIVAKVEALLGGVGAARERLAKVPDLLKRFRQSVLAAACSGQLTADWRGAERGTATSLLQEILTDRQRRWERQYRKTYVVPLQPDEHVISEVPEGWELATLDQLTVYGPRNGLYKPKSAYGNGTPIIRIDDFQNDFVRSRSDLSRLQVTNEEAQKYGVRPRDLIVNRVNSPSHIGKCMLVPEDLCPAVFESNMMSMTLSPLIVSKWILLFLQSADGRERLTANAKWAVNQVSINQTDVRSTAVPLPPLAEQQEVVRRVQSLFTLADRIEERLKTATQRAGALPQSILARAFRGELVPTEAELARRQNRPYEPASTLLARLRAERNDASQLKGRRQRRTEGRQLK